MLVVAVLLGEVDDDGRLLGFIRGVPVLELVVELLVVQHSIIKAASSNAIFRSR